MTDTDQKRRRPTAMAAAMREVTHLCALADCTAEEYLQAINVVAARGGVQYRHKSQEPDVPPDY